MPPLYKMNIEMMADLETLATEPDAHILSIGACLLHAPERHFYRVIGTKEQYRRVDMNTIDWWCKQSEAARNEVLIETDITLKSALKDFIQFFKDSGAKTIWSHGCDFDTVILTDAFRQHDLKCPWSFYNTEHTRTLIRTAERLKGKTFEPNRNGVHHNALHDAQFQAQWMQNIWQGLKDE